MEMLNLEACAKMKMLPGIRQRDTWSVMLSMGNGHLLNKSKSNNQ